MSDFKFDLLDQVRIINPDHKDFDDVGVVRGRSTLTNGLVYEVAFSEWHRPTFREADLVLADPDVHTVMDEVGAESTPKLPAFTVGERVMVLGHVGSYGGRFGEVMGSEDDGAVEWLVRLDGNPVSVPFSGDELTRGVPAEAFDRAAGRAKKSVSMDEREIDGEYVPGATDAVDHPAHYGGDTTYETIKVIEAWGLGFGIGNCVKYLSRAGKKGHALEDLKKARFYLQREIDKLEGPL